MKDAFKPSGYNSVSPYVVVRGAQQMIDLLKKIFDVKELRRYDDGKGRIVHGEVMLDDSIIMIADSTEQWPPNKSLIHVYVKDVDATYKRALEAGCQSVQEPRVQEGDPDRRGGFNDFSGNSWFVSTQQEE